MIRSIELVNVKCFSEQNISFSNLNIFTGINGTGKSTVIQSILLVSQTEVDNAISLNGPLVQIGDYSDWKHEYAKDDSSSIAIENDVSACRWGFAEDYITEANNVITHLPLIDGNVEVISTIESNLIYISAERWGPRDNVPINKYHTNPYWLGKHGEFTIPFLYSLKEGSLKGSDNKMVRMDNDPRIHADSDISSILPNIVAWMGEISPNVDVDVSVIKEAVMGYSSFSFKNSKKYKATNVGFGLSYALSIVTALVAAPKGAIVVLENPEAHLHPRGQSKLGQLMALAAKAGVQVIVETHSEHIINGARIMVRTDVIAPDMINIMFVSRHNEKPESGIETLQINDMGQLNNWPEGFFDQQAIDMKTLMTGA